MISGSIRIPRLINGSCSTLFLSRMISLHPFVMSSSRLVRKVPVMVSAGRIITHPCNASSGSGGWLSCSYQLHPGQPHLLVCSVIWFLLPCRWFLLLLLAHVLLVVVVLRSLSARTVWSLILVQGSWLGMIAGSARLVV